MKLESRLSPSDHFVHFRYAMSITISPMLHSDVVAAHERLVGVDRYLYNSQTDARFDKAQTQHIVYESLGRTVMF